MDTGAMSDEKKEMRALQRYLNALSTDIKSYK